MERLEFLTQERADDFFRTKKLHYINRLLVLDCAESTNTLCKSDEISVGTAVLARTQTAGHGRLGRGFLSEDGGIYISFCLSANIKADRLGVITGMTAVAVLRTAKRVCGIDTGIKWLNDILFDGKKICGILAEPTFSGSESPEKIIIGIGFNLNQQKSAFRGDLSETAGSVYSLTGRKSDISDFVFALSEEIDRAVLSAEQGDISEYLCEYRKACANIGKEVYILPFEKDGLDPRATFEEDASRADFRTETVIGITDDFELATSRRVVRSGEASIKEKGL